MTAAVDALVIGAGVAGSSLAYALAQAGWTVVLADKIRFPRHKACGEFLSPESLAILRSLGLEEAVRALAPVPITLARLHAEKGGSLEIPLPAPALGISRHKLDARLQQAAGDSGAVIRTSCQAAVVKEQDGKYVAQLGPDKEIVVARTVFGAWGRTPPGGIPRMGGSRRGRPRIGIKAHYVGANASPAVDLYFFRGGYVGLAGVEDGRLNVAALLPEPAKSESSQEVMERILSQAAASVPQLRQRLAGARLEPGTSAGAYPVIPSRKALAWSSMPLIGDAAAVIPPLCGDGMAMALRSAALCAPLADAYLRGRLTRDEWRRTYAVQLEREFSGALRRGSRLDRVFAHPWAASWLLRLGNLVPSVAAHMFRATRIRMEV